MGGRRNNVKFVLDMWGVFNRGVLTIGCINANKNGVFIKLYIKFIIQENNICIIYNAKKKLKTDTVNE